MSLRTTIQRLVSTACCRPLSALVLGILLTPSFLVAAPPVQVGVRFVNATEVFAPIEGPPMTELGRSAEQMAAALLEGRLRYVDWVPSGKVGEGAVQAELVLRLEEEPLLLELESGQTITARKIFLRHYGRLPSQAFELRQKHELLYDVGALMPIQDPQRLLLKVLDHLENIQFADDYIDTIEDDMLRRISLTNSLRTDPLGHRILIPLTLETLKATPDSLLGVNLIRNDLIRGSMVLKAASQVDEADCPKCILARIQSFEVPPHDDIEAPLWWHDRLPEIFAGAQKLHVYMHTYKMDIAAGSPPTIDDLFTEPEL